MLGNPTSSVKCALQATSLLFCFLLSVSPTASAEVSTYTLDYQALAAQLIQSDSSPLSLSASLDLYELHQIAIIQRHIDTLSLDVYQVSLHFGVRAACKSNAPSDCTDETRRCQSSFSLDHSIVKDDVTQCQPLPEMFALSDDDGRVPPQDPRVGLSAQTVGCRKKSLSNDLRLEQADIESSEDQDSDLFGKEFQSFLGAASQGVGDYGNQNKNPGEAIEDLKADKQSKTAIKHMKLVPFIETKSSNSDQSLENDLEKTNILGMDKEEFLAAATVSHLQKEVKPSVTGTLAHPSLDNIDSDKTNILGLDQTEPSGKTQLKSSKRNKPLSQEPSGQSLSNIDLLKVATSAVASVNIMSKGELNLTLSNILNVSRVTELSMINYTLTVECHQAGDAVPIRCDIGCVSLPWLTSEVRVEEYSCNPVRFGGNPPVEKVAKNGDATGSINNGAISNSGLTMVGSDSQVSLIAEFVMIQMDVLDIDNYRRVLLNVTSIEEEVTMDGSGVQYSLSIMMVSTTCEETSVLGDMQASQSCLNDMVSTPQCCDVDCVRSFSSSDGPRLVSSQCGPVLSDVKA